MSFLNKRSFLNFFLYFAVTAWPFLNFYASNANYKLIYLRDYIYLFIFTFVLFVLTLEIIHKFYKISRERILISYTLFIILFFNYIVIWKYFSAVHFLHDLPYKYVQYILMSCLLFIIFYKLSKSIAFQRAVAVFVFVIFFFSLTEVLMIIFDKENNLYSPSKIPIETFIFKNKPNIYFLLLDAYARRDTVKSNTNFDNKEFLEFLKNRGFIVSDKSYSNYNNTSMSLSATFNMDYIKEIEINRSDILSPDKAVFKILRENNYGIIIIPGYFHFLSGSNVADITISSSSWVRFIANNQSFLAKTMLQAFVGIFRSYFYINIQHIKQIFNLDRKKSNFIFIHYLNLHDLAYEKNCTVEPEIFANSKNLPYDHHLSCMNLLIKDSIDLIKKNDPNSIIIVQGDHGPLEWRNGEDYPKNSKAFEEMFAVISAIYIPGLDKKGSEAAYLSNSPSPVNNFRIIFSYLAESEAKILPDKHFDMSYNELSHYKKEDAIK